MNFPRRCEDPEAMRALGGELAGLLEIGGIVALDGDLGAGKTELVKGLAAGLGYEGAVTSPTFTLLHEYRGGAQPLFHLDFYRLARAREVLELGWDELLEGDGIVAVEWASRFADLLPPEALWIRIEMLPEGGRILRRGAPSAQATGGPRS